MTASRQVSTGPGSSPRCSQSPQRSASSGLGPRGDPHSPDPPDPTSACQLLCMGKPMWEYHLNCKCNHVTTPCLTFSVPALCLQIANEAIPDITSSYLIPLLPPLTASLSTNVPVFPKHALQCLLSPAQAFHICSECAPLPVLNIRPALTRPNPQWPPQAGDVPVTDPISSRLCSCIVSPLKL